MRARCCDNEPVRLPEHARGRAWQFESTYPLTIGRSYTVVAIAILEGVLELLVVDDWGGPLFAPAAFFEMNAAALPEGWVFGLGPGNRARGSDLWSNPVVAMWGYPELFDIPGHADALLEREPAAIEIFTRYASGNTDDHRQGSGED